VFFRLPRHGRADGGRSLATAGEFPGRTHAGPDRRALDQRPRNANELSTELDLDYTTVRHHLDVLMENGVVRRTDDDYAAVYRRSRPSASGLDPEAVHQAVPTRPHEKRRRWGVLKSPCLQRGVYYRLPSAALPLCTQDRSNQYHPSGHP